MKGYKKDEPEPVWWNYPEIPDGCCSLFANGEHLALRQDVFVFVRAGEEGLGRLILWVRRSPTYS